MSSSNRYFKDSATPLSDADGDSEDGEEEREGWPGRASFC